MTGRAWMWAALFSAVLWALVALAVHQALT